MFQHLRELWHSEAADTHSPHLVLMSHQGWKTGKPNSSRNHFIAPPPELGLSGPKSVPHHRCSKFAQRMSCRTKFVRPNVNLLQLLLPLYFWLATLRCRHHKGPPLHK